MHHNNTDVPVDIQAIRQNRALSRRGGRQKGDFEEKAKRKGERKKKWV
jgi:hypothetical protein